MSTGGRVLSIQSHVVRGYVGNKCSVFPLQLLGFDVDPINSVHFSNHTGYASFQGTVLQGAELTNLLHGLESNDLLGGYTHMLTGYIGSPSFLHTVIDVYRRLKMVNPGMLFICDPVLGDEGRLYVPAENVHIYREEVLPLATMITPNQYEAELLSGVMIHTEEDAVRACMTLHARGPDTVVITSSRLAGSAAGMGAAGANGDRDDIVLIASTRRRPRAHGDTSPSSSAQQAEALLPTAQRQTGVEAAEAESGGGGGGVGGGGGWNCRAGGGDSGGGDGGGGGFGGGNLNRHRQLQAAVAGNNGGDAGGGGWQGFGSVQEAGAEAGAEAGGGGVDRVAAGGGDGDGGGGDGGGGGGGEGAGAGEADPGSEEGFDVYRMTFPRLPQHFTGTGDLAAALLLAWTHRLPGDLAGALERVAGSMRAVLTRTYNQGSAELLLVQSKVDIERPPLDLRATTVVTGH